MKKEEEIMAFLHLKVFDPVLNSPTASRNIKSGVNLTIARLQERDAVGMLSYFWYRAQYSFYRVNERGRF
jgi:hypothetical protein